MPNKENNKKDDNTIYLYDLEQLKGEDLSNSPGISADNTSDDTSIKLHDLIDLIKLREKYLHDERIKQEEIDRINAQIDFQLKEKMAIMQNALLQNLYEARLWEINNRIFEMQQRQSQQMIKTAMMSAYTQYNFG